MNEKEEIVFYVGVVAIASTIIFRGDNHHKLRWVHLAIAALCAGILFSGALR